VILVGDGASDLEVKGDADMVIGFGRYAVRPKVKAGADAFIMSLAELPELVAARSDGVTGIAPRDPSTPPDMRFSASGG
jgi:hypothetical protein